MPRKKNQKNNGKTIALIIIFMAAAAGVAIYIGVEATGGKAASNIVNVDLPLIVTPMTQPATGEEFNVQTLFSVKLNAADRRELSDAELTEALTEIMQEMDADKILSKGKVEYLNERATTLLNERLAEQEISSEVLVVDLATNDSVRLTGPSGGTNKVMEGLFQNIN